MEATETAKKENTTFKKLYSIDLHDKIGKKLGLSYLSWSDAWAELLKNYPDSTYKIYTRTIKTTSTKTIVDKESGETNTIVTETTNEVPYFTDGMTCFVKVGVTVEGVEKTEIYPVMDNKNNSIPYSLVKSTNINRALQRAFVKACARHGLGLYIYSGEDFPEDKRINLSETIKEADRIKITPLDATSFNNMKEGIISFIQSQGENIDPALYSYVQSLFPQKRLSALSLAEDCNNIQKLNYVIQKLLA